jgi:SAM-dependent methyltransferase
VRRRRASPWPQACQQARPRTGTRRAGSGSYPRRVAVQDHIPTRLGTAALPLIERVFYNDRLSDGKGRPARVSPARRPIVALNRALFERGKTPPWVWSPNQAANYWAGQEHDDQANNPSTYSRKPLEVIEWLREFWSPEIGSDASVLEVGTNAGPNLEGLRQSGYSKLSGVEINPAAIAEMGRAFPELSAMATIHEGHAEQALGALPADSQDLVFSMAVLVHVHPASNQVMTEMVRVARRYVCVLEAEDVTCGYLFARNYRRVFERLGCTEVRTAPVLGESFPTATPEGYVGYRARLFQVPAR